MAFQVFPKMGRLTRDCIITEKIDGTNAQIEIVHSLFLTETDRDKIIAERTDSRGTQTMYAGSRTRYITPTDDNFGFAAWVKANVDALWALGAGRHYGEWWGSGIQRGYGLSKGEKRFSLFNATRWGGDDRPACCSVVPVLYRGLFGESCAANMIAKLANEGSQAAPGFMNPEGIVIFHTAAGTMFKKTIHKDEEPKTRGQ